MLVGFLLAVLLMAGPGAFAEIEDGVSTQQELVKSVPVLFCYVPCTHDHVPGGSQVACLMSSMQQDPEAGWMSKERMTYGATEH